MVGVGPYGEDDMLARVSLVAMSGDVLYDKYVTPKLPVTDYRTPISGVTAEHLAHHGQYYRNYAFEFAHFFF